jgi:hypothetical protein
LPFFFWRDRQQNRLPKTDAFFPKQVLRALVLISATCNRGQLVSPVSFFEILHSVFSKLLANAPYT